jgi:hypothetical protein
MKFDKQLSKYFSGLGRKSAKARMKKISAKQRSEIASNAAKARWAKKKRKKK